MDGMGVVIILPLVFICERHRVLALKLPSLACVLECGNFACRRSEFKTRTGKIRTYGSNKEVLPQLLSTQAPIIIHQSYMTSYINTWYPWRWISLFGRSSAIKVQHSLLADLEPKNQMWISVTLIWALTWSLWISNRTLLGGSSHLVSG